MTPNRRKEIRNELGMSVTQLSDFFGLSRSNGPDKVREYERGARDPTGPIDVLYGVLEYVAEIQPQIQTDLFTHLWREQPYA